MGALVLGIEPEKHLVLFNRKAFLKFPSPAAGKDSLEADSRLFNHCFLESVHNISIGGFLKKHEAKKRAGTAGRQSRE
jgi:hypothetical protein